MNPNVSGETSAVTDTVTVATETSSPAFVDEGGKYVTFRTGNEYYGLKIQYVNEIIVLQEITEIPESEDYIKGLINLRGKIIPVIDVRLRFRKEPIEYNDRTCIIVINSETTVVGLIVEQIAEVVEIGPKDITPSPAIGNVEMAQNKYVYAIGKVGNAVKLLLDPEKLIKYTEIPAPPTSLDELDKKEIEKADNDELKDVVGNENIETESIETVNIGAENGDTANKEVEDLEAENVTEEKAESLENTGTADNTEVVEETAASEGTEAVMTEDDSSATPKKKGSSKKKKAE
ncbi:MAG: purine-binding chemotaxis protein CheW [Clostridia bacterium]|nr:purine-binding chemotaxis protein CheW [Clostridia bacterium]